MVFEMYLTQHASLVPLPDLATLDEHKECIGETQLTALAAPSSSDALLKLCEGQQKIFELEALLHRLVLRVAVLEAAGPAV